MCNVAVALRTTRLPRQSPFLNFWFLLLSPDASGMLNCPPPELIMTEADAIVDPDSDDEPERKDSLDVHEEGKFQQIYSLYSFV